MRHDGGVLPFDLDSDKRRTPPVGRVDKTVMGLLDQAPIRSHPTRPAVPHKHRHHGPGRQIEGKTTPQKSPGRRSLSEPDPDRGADNHHGLTVAVVAVNGIIPAW